MTTAIASPPTFQPLSRVGWSGPSTGNTGFSAMNSDEVSRMIIPQRKTVQRSNSSSSLASNNSNSSTTTIVQTDGTPSANVAGDSVAMAKKKARGGFWPAKAESTSSVTTARATGAVQSSGVGSLINKGQLQPVAASSSNMQANGGRVLSGPTSNEATAILALLPLNGTFERKQINVPFFPDVLRIGRQTNAKTVPTQVNGFFDSKVLSRQHAEVWADRNGKVWIRDVKSSNGTFVNGQRLSPENRESEPHELRQHDTLELGIDIVSEDQKTIVHHKVSAKVEYVGLPGTPNNILDLNFGDLDPSSGVSLLPSPLSTPMTQSRSRLGGPMANGRVSAPGSVIGGRSVASAPGQRQMNFWGAPLNVEQLVKTLATEMRAAKQQAQELEQASTFLTAVLTPDPTTVTEGGLSAKESNNSRSLNGRVKAPRLDPRFTEPDVPPPQQPLPEIPDVTDASKPSRPAGLSPAGMLKRSDTAKAPINTVSSPANAANSQMLSLIEALSIAKKELDSQGARVKQLEDMLKQERSAREDAEERARRLEQPTTARPVQSVETEPEPEPRTETDDIEEVRQEEPSQPVPETDHRAAEQSLQLRLDQMMADMQRMKSEMDKFQRRAETAETDASNSRASLAEMINKLRAESSKEESKHLLRGGERAKFVDTVDTILDETEDLTRAESKGAPGRPAYANGHVKRPKLPVNFDQTVTKFLRDSQGNGEMLAQSAPFVSMLGVVLIGVGLMAYLNSWQKSER